MKLKHTFAIAGAVLATLLALAAAYLHVIGRDIEPADFSDLDLPPVEPVPAEENAFTYLARARDAYVETKKDGEYVSYFELRDNPILIAEALAANTEMFQHLERAAQCARCVYPVLATINDPVFRLHNFGAIARLMSIKIKYELENNAIEAALRDVETLLRCGQLMRQNPTSLSEALVAMMFKGTGLDAIQQLAKNPNASEDQLRRLRELLENTPSYAATMSHARKGEFQVWRMGFDEIKAKGKRSELVYWHQPPFIPKFLYRRLFLINQTLLDYANKARVTISNIPKFYSDVTLPSYEYPADGQSWLGTLLSRNGAGKILLIATEIGEAGIFCEKRCEMDAHVAATQIIIACHLFQRATGRKPQTLDELVPDFLPSVPLDPFDGKPFRYKPEEGIVYSVGAKLEDFPGNDDKLVFKIWE